MVAFLINIMVLERIINVKHGRKQPLLIFFLGFIVSIIALFISYTVFKESTGLFTVVIISLVMVPFLNKMMHYEEHETEKTGENETFFQRHGDIISAYGALFCGITIAMSLVFVLLPCDNPENIDTCAVSQIFDEQIKEVNLIQGHFTFGNQFLDIFANNMSVLMISFLFSFLLGTGAILILSWNASVLSSAIGLLSKSFGGIRGMPVAILTFIPHGFFELTAYFIGAIAGGLISAALMRKKSYKFWYIVKDSMKLLLVSVIFLVIGAVVETAIILV